MRTKIILGIFAVLSLVFLFKWAKTPPQYLVVGTANPGEIYLYKLGGTQEKKIKSIDTGYKFVHSVRIGDIYNDGGKYIVAGISNSFYEEPFGCKVVAYELKNFQESLVDDVGDVRCKDLTIGDADNDGKNEIVLGTHGEGIIRLYKWEEGAWKKETLEENFISQIDRERDQKHAVPKKDIPCPTCILHTAVHIVKVADIDNDGKNEVVATLSSPLELKGTPEITFINVYRKTNGEWKRETLDELENREFRSIEVGDVFNKGKNVLVIGIGSLGSEKGSLLAYEFESGKWKKSVIHNDEAEKNMKGVAIGEISTKGKNSLLLGTGFPSAKIMIIDWIKEKFEKKEVGSISALLEEKGAEFNIMAAFLDGRTPARNIFVAGMSVFPLEKMGWEDSPKGFLVKYRWAGKKWIPKVIEERNILGMDLN